MYHNMHVGHHRSEVLEIIFMYLYAYIMIWNAPRAVVWLPVCLAGRPGEEEVTPRGHRHIVAVRAA